jgi:hypothetical protein
MNVDLSKYIHFCATIPVRRRVREDDLYEKLKYVNCYMSESVVMV